MKSIGLSHIAAALCLCFFLTACDSANPDESLVTSSVYVANQGNFTDGTGSITAYDPQTGTSSELAGSFGSTIQGMHLMGNSLYVSANSASRVDIISTETGNRVGQIPDVVSPRYFTQIGDDRLFVTNLFQDTGSFTGGAVTLLDTDSNSIVDTVHVGNNPEGSVVVGPRLYVANNGFGEETTLTTLNHASLTRTGTIDVNCWGPRFLAVDQEAEVFVFCAGKTIYDQNFNPIGEVDGEIVVLDGATGNQVKRIDIDGRVKSFEGFGQDIFHSPETNEIFFVQDENTVVCIDTNSNDIDREFAVAGDPIGAVAYDHVNDRFYLGRIPGFTQAGSVTIHDVDGNQTGLFAAGIAPSHIVFSREEQ